MNPTALEARQHYRAVWWAVAVPLALAGSVIACLFLGLRALLLVSGVAVLIALCGWALRVSAEAEPPAPPSPADRLLGGVAALAVTGLALEFGAAGWWVGVLVLGAGWPVLRRRGRASAVLDTATGTTAGTTAPGSPTTATQRRPLPTERPSRVCDAPAIATLPAHPLPEPTGLPALSTAELCWAWRVSYLRVQHATCASQLEHLARLRAGFLDELQRRDSAAYLRWLPTARAASDPARFFCPRPQHSPQPQQCAAGNETDSPSTSQRHTAVGHAPTRGTVTPPAGPPQPPASRDARTHCA